jgi:two-component system sensor histidine kinase/response regulator
VTPEQLHALAGQRPLPPAADHPSIDTTRPCVLLADDEEANRLALRPILREHYRLIEVENGPSALERLEQERVDLVLLDVMMPEMTGYEVCKRIKEQRREAFLPVLLVTGLTDRAQRKLGLQSGADDFLTKPVDPEELLLRTRSFLRLRAQDSLIRQQLRELARMQTAKDEFISLMMHDLRSPLSGIMAHLQLLLEDLGEGTHREYASAALRASDLMFSTLEDALQVRLLEEGQLQIARHPVNLAEIVRSALVTGEALARRKRIALDVQVDASEPVLLDGKLVRRAIENLLGNAVKYTPSGKDIRVRARHAGDVVAIEVADRGPGIPTEMRSSMFEKFGSVELKKGGARKGIGLGLYMVKLVAEGHGGKAEVLDREGGGALFRVELRATSIGGAVALAV